MPGVTRAWPRRRPGPAGAGSVVREPAARVQPQTLAAGRTLSVQSASVLRALEERDHRTHTAAVVDDDRLAPISVLHADFARGGDEAAQLGRRRASSSDGELELVLARVERD